MYLLIIYTYVYCTNTTLEMEFYQELTSTKIIAKAM